MKLPRLRTILLTPLVLFLVFYVVGASILALRDVDSLDTVEVPSVNLSVAVFGASGTAGDGILKSALASQNIDNIFVVTRRVTPRIEQGIAAGKVTMILHTDYLEYSAIIEQLKDIDAVFWAIGINSIGVDEKTYGMIHVDFPMQFVKAWRDVSHKADLSFHYISSSDIADDSSAMWAREKVRAEKSLFAFAQGSKLRVIAYRPDYIGPTREQAHLGQNLLYWFFKPVGAAVRATQIGQAMIDIALRGTEIDNGSKLSTGKILLHSDAYHARGNIGS